MEARPALSATRTTIRRVAVIGAGPQGWRLAAKIAKAGFQTVIEDVLPSNLRRAARNLQDDAIEPANGPDAAVSPHVAFASTVEEAVRDADLAIDLVPDELESKLEILTLLDRMAPPRTILCTPTSALSIADLASCTYRADRCVAVQSRPANLRTPLAEAAELHLVYSHWTRAEVIEAVSQFWLALGKIISSELDASMMTYADMAALHGN